jgi:hypothetical protein
LKKVIKAYQCQHRSCTFIAASEDWIRQHANQKHGWKKSTELPRLWKSVRAQTFFTERKLTKYFVVEAGDCELNGEANSGSEAETTTENAPQTTPIQPLQPGHVRVSDCIRSIQQRWSLAEEKQEKKLAQLDKDVLKQDRTGWYNRTGWPEHLGESNMRFLAAASRVPDKNEALLKEAVRIMNLVFKQALVSLGTLDLETQR